jgi:hypothetical protein
MQRDLKRSVPALFAGVACMIPLTGCSQPPPATSFAESTPRERSQFFAQMAAEPKAGSLKVHFEKRFPALAFQVGAAGPVTIRPSGGGPAKVQVEVSLAVKDVTPKYKGDHSLILAELETYLKELLASSGMELNGPVHETVKNGEGRVLVRVQVGHPLWCVAGRSAGGGAWRHPGIGGGGEKGTFYFSSRSHGAAKKQNVPF